MARPVFQWTFGYTDIAKLCGVSTNAVSQAVSRGNLAPDDLLSVATFIAAHGEEEVRIEIMTAFARMGNYQYPGRPASALTTETKAKRKKRATKKATKKTPKRKS